jgi:two-component system, NarL family, sensor histidine kinase UhpB
MEAGEINRMRARRDLLWIVMLTGGFALLCVWLELSEVVLSWTRPHERFQLDEIPGVLLFLAVALTWYAWRRVGEARRELELRIRTEARLRAALVQNRELAQANVRIQEEERRTLARELHDELGQYLNALKIDAVCLRDGASGQIPDVRDSALAIVGVTSHLEEIVRDMVRRLRPPGLDELGLAAAIEACVDGWRRRLPSVNFMLKVDADLDQLDEATNMTLYRLVQEGLTNVAKHADATSVNIELHQHSVAVGTSEAVLTLRDNGAGSRGMANEPGLGIVGMRERVEGLAGRFDLAPAGGGGFGFTAWLPVHLATAG